VSAQFRRGEHASLLGDVHHVMGVVDAAREHWARALGLHRMHDRQRAAEEIERKLQELTPAG
jgi:hypothetical protein